MKIKKLITTVCTILMLSISIEPSFAISASTLRHGESSFKYSKTEKIANHQLKKTKKKKKNVCRTSDFYLDTDSSIYPEIVNDTRCKVKFELVISRCEFESLDCATNNFSNYDYIVAWVSKYSSVKLKESYGFDYMLNWDGYFYDFDLNVLKIVK